MDIDKKLGMQIKRIRQLSGINQVEFAEQCSVSKTHFGRLERGENSMTIGTLFLISKELGISMSDLLRSIGY